ncbi:MAG: SpoIVB peptidase [Ruminococcus sp.]|jgi:stage IV sporulation protein B|nr:SpoIVB peptidase [Ruminococcus sp.]
MERIVKIILTLINTAVLAAAGLIVYFNVTLPDTFYVSSGDITSLPGPVSVTDGGGFITVMSRSSRGTETVIPSRMHLRLFGIIPIKDVTVEAVGTPELIPLGNPFGIKMLTDGVMVVDTNSFETPVGFSSPAQNAGIRPGDVIKTIDGEAVFTNSDVASIIGNSGDIIEVKILRGGNEYSVLLSPELSISDGMYKAGMWVKDSSAGIGTMTFYDKTTGIAAGLGHPVTDSQTGELMPLYSGEAVRVSIDRILRGKTGFPGELTGTFMTSDEIGTLVGNTESGVYTRLQTAQDDEKALPLGFKQDIKTGEATILSTINGETPKSYKILIESINLRGDETNSRDMVIKVVDEELLRQTGGIVQGMSGSPIIQDGKLIGAVTHVFVNNPTKGYAIFADTMYAEQKAYQNNFSIGEAA